MSGYNTTALPYLAHLTCLLLPASIYFICLSVSLLFLLACPHRVLGSSHLIPSCSCLSVCLSVPHLQRAELGLVRGCSPLSLRISPSVYLTSIHVPLRAENRKPGDKFCWTRQEEGEASIQHTTYTTHDTRRYGTASSVSLAISFTTLHHRVRRRTYTHDTTHNTHATHTTQRGNHQNHLIPNHQTTAQTKNKTKQNHLQQLQQLQTARGSQARPALEEHRQKNTH